MPIIHIRRIQTFCTGISTLSPSVSQILHFFRPTLQTWDFVRRNSHLESSISIATSSCGIPGNVNAGGARSIFFSSLAEHNVFLATLNTLALICIYIALSMITGYLRLPPSHTFYDCESDTYALRIVRWDDWDDYPCRSLRRPLQL